MDSLALPQELIDRIVDHVVAPLRGPEGQLILRKDAQVAKDLFALTLIPRLEAGSSRVLFGQLTVGNRSRTVPAFASAVKGSYRLSLAIVSLNIDLDNCDVSRSASIEDLETIILSLRSLVKLRIRNRRGNTGPSLRRRNRQARPDPTAILSIQDLTLSSLDIDAVLQCLTFFTKVTELTLENIFCANVPTFQLSKNSPSRLAVRTLQFTRCHPALAGLLSAVIDTQYPVDRIELYNVVVSLEYKALRHLLCTVGREAVEVTLELTNRWAKNPYSVHPKVLFSALADFWQLRTLHVFEDSDVEEPGLLLFFYLTPHLPSDLRHFRIVLRFYPSVVEHIKSDSFMRAIEELLARYPRLYSLEITVDLREYANPIDPSTEAREAVEQLKAMLSYVYRDRVSFAAACSPYYVDLTRHEISLGML